MSEKIPKNPLLFGIFISKLYKKWVFSALFFVFVATALSRYSVIILKNLTDAISAAPLDINNVWLWAIIFALLFIISENLWRASGFMGMRWFMNFRFSAYQTLYEYLTLHSKDYFNSRFSGSLANKIANAVDGTQAIFEKSLWNFIPLALGLVWFILFSALSNLWLGLIIGVWSIIFLIINIWFAKKLQPSSYESAKSLSVLKGKVVDSLSNISLVHEYAYVAGEREYIKHFVKKSRDAGFIQWHLSEWMLVANGFLLFIFVSLMVGFSVFLFQNKIISVGVIIMVISIIGHISDQLLFLGQEIRDTTRYYGEAKEGLTEILKEHLIVDAPNATTLQLAKGTIDFEAVDFEYENNKVFTNFSLSIQAGQKIGLVGKSGAGKTTFVSLLLRHFDIQEGEIKIDGQSIANVTLESLRKSIAFVPQDTSLFHRSIKENIRYSNPEASDEDVQKAAKLANAYEFIEKLPKSYETPVGERGVKLSGGQRQRIAIARAFLKNAPILILDEATSNLDSESEHQIQLSLDQLMQNKTVIAIAHRLSTLKKMDRIIVIKNGKVIEDGNPDKLLQQPDSIFKNMWDHQVKGFIVDE
ncbi:ABC transporter ATP-binding protein [Candidatus Roizmanbacteria bacterium]|nr:ABC transporter ATP-binding protein [Candidatus Roizmanbacteria bacterium]